jgi:hypothetical protein
MVGRVSRLHCTCWDDAVVHVDISAIDSPVFILIAAVANAADGATTDKVTTISYAGLTFSHLVGGNVAGTAFS